MTGNAVVESDRNFHRDEQMTMARMMEETSTLNAMNSRRTLVQKRSSASCLMLEIGPVMGSCCRMDRLR